MEETWNYVHNIFVSLIGACYKCPYPHTSKNSNSYNRLEDCPKHFLCSFGKFSLGQQRIDLVAKQVCT